MRQRVARVVRVLGALVTLFFGLRLPAQVDADTKADFFVAVSGNDGGSGKIAESNATRTDGPFATIVRARNVVRELKLTSTQKGIWRPGGFRRIGDSIHRR